MDAVLRLGYGPVRGFIETIGAMMLLLRKTIVAALTPPYDYGPELVDQFLFALRLGWFPMILASLAFTYGPAGSRGRRLPQPARRDRPARRACS